MSIDLKFDHTKSATNNDRRESNDRQSHDIGRNQFALSLITRTAIAIGIVWTVNTAIKRIDNAEQHQGRVQTTRALQR